MAWHCVQHEAWWSPICTQTLDAIYFLDPVCVRSKKWISAIYFFSIFWSEKTALLLLGWQVACRRYTSIASFLGWAMHCALLWPETPGHLWFWLLLLEPCVWHAYHSGSASLCLSHWPGLGQECCVAFCMSHLLSVAFFAWAMRLACCTALFAWAMCQEMWVALLAWAIAGKKCVILFA